MDITELKRRAGISAITEDVAMNGKLQYTKQIKITDLKFSADDWELYNNEGRDQVANMLNTVVKNAVNSGDDTPQILKTIENAMYRYRGMGASDSEPRAVLSELMGAIGLDV